MLFVIILILLEKTKKYLNNFEKIYKEIAPISCYIPKCSGLGTDGISNYSEILFKKK
jgi:ribosomal protein L10